MNGIGAVQPVEATEAPERPNWMMQDWEEHLFYERSETAARMKRLELMLRNAHIGPYPPDDDYRALLDRQHGVMKELLEILDARIDRI